MTPFTDAEKYPRTIDQWGSNWWNVMTDMAMNYPSNPSRSDRIDFNTMLRQMIKYLPCQNECKDHARNWVSANPPPLDNNKELAKYMCRFKNSVNERQGKPLKDCDTMFRPITGIEDQNQSNNNCPSCMVGGPSTVNDSTKGTVMASVDGNETGKRAEPKTIDAEQDKTPHSLSHYTTTTRILKESKNKKKELFEALCKEYNDPIPKSFRFEVCPNHPETSCIDYNDIENITPYLNPYTDSDKQVLHEFQHYHTLVKTGKISSETDAERFAYSRISRAYPLPKNSNLRKQMEEGQEETEQTAEETPLERTEKVSTQQSLESQTPNENEEKKPSYSPEQDLELPTTDKPSESSSSPSPSPMQEKKEGLFSGIMSALSKDQSPPTANVDMIKQTQPKNYSTANNQSSKPNAVTKEVKQLHGIDKTIQDIADTSAVSLADLDTSLEGPNTTTGYDQRFPNYSKLNQEIEARKKNAEIDRKLNEGFITYLDPIYKYPARALGLKESHMNLAHTPEIIHNLIMTLVQSNTTSIGAGLFSFLTGISLFVTGYLARSSIAFKDQIALQNVSAAFLWRTLEYINPKTEMKKQVKSMYHRIQEGDLRLTDALIETPGMWKKKEHKKKHAWMYMPHRLGKDEKGRPAFIIPAPYALQHVSQSPGAPMGGLIGDADRNSMMSYYAMAATTPGAGSPAEARNINASQNPLDQDPVYQLQGSGYYDIGGEEDDAFGPVYGSPSVDPDLLRNVFVAGS